jgi:hypothetical protein
VVGTHASSLTVRNPALGKFKQLPSSSAAFGGDPKDDF